MSSRTRVIIVLNYHTPLSRKPLNSVVLGHWLRNSVVVGQVSPPPVTTLFMGFHLAIKLHTKYETLRDMRVNSGYSENIFPRVYHRDFESLDVVVIINFWLLQMASSRRTNTAAEAF